MKYIVIYDSGNDDKTAMMDMIMVAIKIVMVTMTLYYLTALFGKNRPVRLSSVWVCKNGVLQM